MTHYSIYFIIHQHSILPGVKNITNCIIKIRFNFKFTNVFKQMNIIDNLLF